MYYLSKILIRILPWDPWLPRCSKKLARSCQDSQDASKRFNPGAVAIANWLLDVLMFRNARNLFKNCFKTVNIYIFETTRPYLAFLKHFYNKHFRIFFSEKHQKDCIYSLIVRFVAFRIFELTQMFGIFLFRKN